MSESASDLAARFKAACLSELEAIKPGNVHIFADGHGMSVQDFIASAEASTPAIVQPGQSVGQRILAAVEASWNVVGCNTNLGIILLCAPMVHAAMSHDHPALRDSLQQTLDGLTVEDAILAFRAIVRASPAGLGESERQDVRNPPDATLLEAMGIAQHRDRIAWQFVHGYQDVFAGVTRYQEALRRWERPAWATTAVYLGFLSDFPDSHLVRKHGAAVALAVQQEGRGHYLALQGMENPKRYQRDLLCFDADLKARGLNPGTSADLTVATLLAASLEQGGQENGD
jgi:triphosphoribosyl-dephospho-CoA synthase